MNFTLKQFVIALTRRCGAGATPIGKILAKNLGVHFYNRDLLRLASDDSGISEELFAKVDEETKKSLLYRVSRKVYDGTIIPPESDNFLSNENLFNYQAKVLNELANRESFVVVGRAANFVLRDRPNVVSVYLYAPEEICVRRKMNLMNFSYDEAVHYVKKQNKYRRGYFTHHTGQIWEDMRNYALCIDTNELGDEGTAKLIEDFLMKRMERIPF